MNELLMEYFSNLWAVFSTTQYLFLFPLCMTVYRSNPELTKKESSEEIYEKFIKLASELKITIVNLSTIVDFYNVQEQEMQLQKLLEKIGLSSPKKYQEMEAIKREMDNLSRDVQRGASKENAERLIGQIAYIAGNKKNYGDIEKLKIFKRRKLARFFLSPSDLERVKKEWQEKVLVKYQQEKNCFFDNLLEKAKKTTDQKEIFNFHNTISDLVYILALTHEEGNELREILNKNYRNNIPVTLEHAKAALPFIEKELQQKKHLTKNTQYYEQIKLLLRGRITL